MKRTISTRILYCFLVGAVIILAIWRTRFGIHSDEIHSIAVGDMIAGESGGKHKIRF